MSQLLSSLPGYPAVWSDDQLYRYVLWRVWGPKAFKNYCMFIGINPSTATEHVNDPTVRRCIGYAQAWGYDALCMTNLFGYRATRIRDMMGQTHPIGTSNDRWLVACASSASIKIAAWGKRGVFMSRDEEVCNLLDDDLYCLRTNADGTPVHPLYQPKNLRPIHFRRPA